MSSYEERHGFCGQTFLYIRTHPNDDGTVPLQADQFWLSPDLAIVQPGGVTGAEAIAGQMNDVRVTVNNTGGIDAVDAFVEVFWADPSTAFAPQTATLIGAGFLTIPGYGDAMLSLPWVPPATETGKRCLLGRVCLCMPPDCYADGSEFHVKGDRHIAQRNIHVVGGGGQTGGDAGASRDAGERAFSFGFRIVNPLKTKAKFLVEAAELRIKRDAAVVRAALGSEFVQFAREPLSDLRVNVGRVIEPRDPSTPGDTSRMPLGVLREPMEFKGGPHDSIRMERGEVRYGVLTVICNPDVRPGDVHVVQVRQVETKVRQTVGGLWVVVQQQASSASRSRS